MSMKLIRALLFAAFISISSVAFAQSLANQPITVYDPDNAIHPFLLTGLILRPPVALLEVLVKGFYDAIDTGPTESVFNIEYEQRFSIDEDY